MDHRTCESILIANALAHGNRITSLDLTPNSNFRVFTDELSLMLAALHVSIDKQFGSQYPDLIEIKKQAIILTENIMPALVRAVERDR